MYAPLPTSLARRPGAVSEDDTTTHKNRITRSPVCPTVILPYGSPLSITIAVADLSTPRFWGFVLPGELAIGSLSWRSDTLPRRLMAFSVGVRYSLVDIPFLSEPASEPILTRSTMSLLHRMQSFTSSNQHVVRDRTSDCAVGSPGNLDL